MRLLIFHGYLLAGTGSNVYNARLSEALVRLGHEVHLLCQERHPQDHRFVDSAGDWDGGTLAVRPTSEGRRPPRCTIYRPNIGSLLPVYVADRYEGMTARPFPDCSDVEIDAYLEANVGAVREVAERVRPEAALANHLIMGPLILGRALGPLAIPYAVKVHGSALEYTVKPHLARFGDAAREGLAQASAILVGSRHTALSLWGVLDDPAVRRRTRLGPPGVDVERFRPQEPRAAAAQLRALAARLGQADSAVSPAGEAGDAFSRDRVAAGAALERLDPTTQRLVGFVGKLIVSKGIDLLVAAWPLVLERVPDAQLVVVGFGGYRQAVDQLIAALAGGDLEAVRAIALAGREPEGAGSPAGPLRHLLEFLDGQSVFARESYLRAAQRLSDRIVLTGRLEHDELADLLPACEALVIPSTFPESFGMVAVEAAACGALPVSADHSGLAEVSRTLARAVPSEAARWLSFGLDEHPVPAIARGVVGWLEAERQLRSQTRDALVGVVRERYSWEGVANGVLSAARGRLEALPSVSIEA